MVLMVGPRAADPGQGDSLAGGDLAEIGVFGAVADVLLAEPAELAPQRRVDREGQGPEQGVVTAG
jgi:hypothetical protein